MAIQSGNRKDSSFRAVSTVPSINKTPGPGTPPLPYPVTNDASGSQGTVASVRFNGSPAFVLDQSTIPSVLGDQPGSLGGIKSGTVGGKVEPTQGSSSVRAGGKWIIRPLDPCTLNSGNTIGIFVPSPPPVLMIPDGAPTRSPNPSVQEKTEKEQAFLDERKAMGASALEPSMHFVGLGKVPDLSKPSALLGDTAALAQAVTTTPGTPAPVPTGTPLALSTSPYAPTPLERELAAAPNQGPDGKPTPEQFAAREKVVRDFYERNDLGQKRAEQDMGVDYDGIPNRNPNGYGIDLGRPAETRKIPPPDRAAQYVGNNHGYPGNFFDPFGDQTPDALGINGENRTLRMFQNPKGEALFTGNGPIIDSWTQGPDGKPLPAKPTPGGGTQMTIGEDMRKNMRCAVCGGQGRPDKGGTCTCWEIG